MTDPIAIARLERVPALEGFTLAFVSGDPDVVAHALGFDDREELRASPLELRTFGSGTSPAEGLAEAIRRAKRAGLALVPEEGDAWRPRIRIHRMKPSIIVQFPGTNLWTAVRENWERYAPGAWELMESAFHGEGPPIHVVSAPKDLVWHADVEIVRGGARYTLLALGDTPTAMVETLALAEEGKREVEHDLWTWFAHRDGLCAYEGTYTTVVGRVCGRVEHEHLVEAMRAIRRAQTALARRSDSCYRACETFLREVSTQRGE